MNETRRKPTTGRQSPTLFDKWHGIFYMPSRIAEAGHTKAFDDPVAEHWRESQRAKRSLVGLEPTSAHTYESEIQRSTTYATPTSPVSDHRRGVKVVSCQRGGSNPRRHQLLLYRPTS